MFNPKFVSATFSVIFSDLLFCLSGLEMKTLPAPKAVAKKLSEAVIRSIYLWNEKYASGYKKLSLGYDYMKTCKKVKEHTCTRVCF